MKCKNKIIAILSALVITINCLCVPASALGGVDIGNYIGGYSQAVGDSIAEFWTTIGEIVKGNITFSEAKDSLIENANNFGNDLLVNYITNVDGETLVDQTAFLRELLDLTLEVGDGITDLVKDLLNINGVTGKPEFDYSGASAGLVVEERGWTYYYKINNGVIHKYADRMILTGDSVHYEAFGPLGEFGSSDVLTYVSKEYNSSVKFYGSWKLIDYTKDTEEVVDYGGSDLLPPTLDDATDEQLLELLYDLIDQLNLAFPDLSTVEGLLRAILVQCVSINGKLDGSGAGGVDVTELKLLLDTSIASLVTSNDKNTNELLKELVAFRNDFKEVFLLDGEEGEEEGEEGEEDVDVGYTDEELQDMIDKLGSSLGKLFNVEYAAKDSPTMMYSSMSKAAPVTTILKVLPSVVEIKGLGKIGVKLLVALVDLISSVVEMVPVYIVTGVMNKMQGIMLNNAKPDDLSFILTIDNQEYEMILISEAILEKDGFVNALIIVRALVGFIILYNWFKWARKFLISMV